MDPVITQIRQELKDHQDLEIRKTSQRFFKEEITCYGIKTAIVLAIAKKYWKVVQRRTRPEIYLLCDELYKSGYLEESFIVSNWTNSLAGHYEREDLPVFKRWIETYINNWASCDGFCNHTMGNFMEQYPEVHQKSSNAGPSRLTAGCAVRLQYPLLYPQNTGNSSMSPWKSRTFCSLIVMIWFRRDMDGS